MASPLIHLVLLLIFTGPVLATYTYSTGVNDCNPNSCKNGGICMDKINAFECDCPPGFNGSLCETNIDECSTGPCNNLGACVDGVNGFTCICQLTCTGTTCDTCGTAPDPACNACLNGGQEVNDTCYCPTGFTGDLCETVTCGDPPCYPYAMVTSTGQLVNDTATYTCPSGFLQCVDPAVATCQASGQWTTLPDVCDRSRYTYLRCYALYPTPCPGSTCLLFTFKTILGYDTATMQIRSGTNVLFAVQYIKYWYQYYYNWYYKWYTYITTRINGVVKHPVWFNGIPLSPGYQATVSIKYCDGQYKLFVNGIHICTINEPLSGATPESLTITGAISVPEVVITFPH